jgi:hypothetical protein
MFAAKARPSPETLFDTTSADDEGFEVSWPSKSAPAAKPSTSLPAAKPATSRAGAAKQPKAKALSSVAEGTDDEWEDSDVDSPPKPKANAAAGNRAVVAKEPKARAPSSVAKGTEEESEGADSDIDAPPKKKAKAPASKAVTSKAKPAPKAKAAAKPKAQPKPASSKQSWLDKVRCTFMHTVRSGRGVLRAICRFKHIFWF